MIKKGDKIKLIRPMGAFTNVGEICEVLNVENGIIDFRFGKYHKGQMSENELGKYFVVVSEKATNRFVKGQLITLKKKIEGLEPMNVDDFFEIEEILAGGVVKLYCLSDKTNCFVSVEVLNDCFDDADKSSKIIYEAEAETEIKNDKVVAASRIEEVMNHSKVIVDTVFGKCTIVSCQLPCGFVIVESSACVSPENYNKEIGIEICMNRIKDKVYEMEGYLLQMNNYDNKKCKCDSECSGHNCSEPCTCNQ